MRADGRLLRSLLLSVSCLASILLVGCAAEVVVRREPGADLGARQSFFVEQNEEDADGIEVLLRDELRRWGRTATAGPAEDVPEGTDVLLRYTPTWERNVFKRFLSSLELRFVDARTQEDVVEVRGPRTMARSLPDRMVQAVIQAALEEMGPAGAD